MPKQQSPTASEAMKKAQQEEQQEISDHPSISAAEEDKSTSDEGTSTSNKQNKDESTSSFQLAKKESNLVAYSKILVVGVIILVAACIGAVTYEVIHNQEKSTYESKFSDMADEITEFSGIRAKQIFDSAQALAASITTYASSVNDTWPFVTYPDFEVDAQLLNRRTGSSTVSINSLVDAMQREEWEKYSTAHANGWLASAHEFDKTVDPALYVDKRYDTSHVYNETLRWNVTGIVPYIWTLDAKSNPLKMGPPAGNMSYYSPVWQRAPASDFSPYVNLDLMSLPTFAPFIMGMKGLDRPLLSDVTNASYLIANYENRFDPAFVAEPHSYIFQPIYDKHTKDRRVVASLTPFLRWGKFFTRVLPTSQTGIIVVLTNSCGAVHTYEIRGPKSVYKGKGFLMDPKFKSIGRKFEFIPYSNSTDDRTYNICLYNAYIYPTEEWKSQFFSNNPIIYTIVVICCFVVTTLVFIFYDMLVQRRQNKIMESATKTHAIVSSLFPSNVRDRLMEEMQTAEEQGQNENKKVIWGAHKNGEMGPLSKNSPQSRHQVKTSENIFGSKPIADLFPDCTIMFGDLVGFTAWASIREPAQVFTLLETIYHSFDVIAKRRRVFKVETVGDCYVACAGLPTPRKDHAIVMAKFANDCLQKMNQLVRDLENSLGPDTGDLSMRIGLHSGPVTAGVLRGEKGRFQLFGDTMNTASRLESTGQQNRIQVSHETAEIITASGKEKWLSERKDRILAKGKGELQTYWLNLHAESSESGSANAKSHTESQGSNPAQYPRSSTALSRVDESRGTTGANGISMKSMRLVNWNVEILAKLLRQIVARRLSSHTKILPKDKWQKLNPTDGDLFSEVKDVIALPQFNAKTFHNHVDPNSIELSSGVMQQLTNYVTRVACLYKDNPFHNFEHASHVTMSVTKLMSRIVNPNDVLAGDGGNSDSKIASDLHDYTFGITTDPLTQFTCVISALIHDADHPGISNAALVKEDHPLAHKYNGRSVAEQYSIDISWNALMEPEFEDLRACIYANEEEFARFRSLIVNIVLATDIMDKDLGALRKARWDMAFSEGAIKEQASESKTEDRNRKATIVLEHLIQASDVAHTMQHWHVYRKWNQRLFRELCVAYQNGHMPKDPAEFWYQGEIGFFDNYVIPLAKKLETCGVFGVSSHEYLNYALANRREWAAKGANIVEEYLKTMEAEREQNQATEKQQLPGGAGTEC